ncbi:MAG: acetolactate synthase small subunit [Candidatus Altiarchaeales archaeon WOR_SM1_86-2]|nr:MAG: acetolactate synthase small subunit [Candidatus Altiarchaeales archaeon WOR_SM1_86-2]ODS39543.1 MAG: acetolactate synthase small subunit [Candidatus Altiarchaeales archaeon WOR_SM1_79]
MKAHIITALVEHKPGVLQRVSSMFARRGFNIENITVGETDNPKIARMTIIAMGDDRVLEQIIKQMNKLVNVIRVSDLDKENSVCRELCLIKVNTPTEKEKSEMIQYTDVFRGRIVDVSHDSLTAEITGDADKMGAFIDLMKGFGIKEIARTGTTAMQRG